MQSDFELGHEKRSLFGSSALYLSWLAIDLCVCEA